MIKKGGQLFLLLTILVSAFLLSGCAARYKDEVLAKAKSEGWNEAQQYAAYHYSLRLFLMEKSTAGEYVFLFPRLSKAQVRERFERFLQDFNNILDPKNEEMWRYIEFFDLRKELEREERIYKATYDRLRVAELADQFTKLIGTGSSYGEETWRVEGYNIKQVFGDNFTSYFKSELIERAKRDGRLQPIEHIVWFADQKLAEKQPNPNNPTDPNDFIWLARRRGIELVNYKVLNPGEKPQENTGNYLEGVRLELVIDLKTNKISMQRESQPALRIFMERGGSGVMVLDTDIENEDIGFGLPDVVETIAVASANDLLTSSNVIGRLFEVKQKYKRVPPRFPPIQFQMAPTGKEEELWEIATDVGGWKVPLGYKNKQGNNYNVKLKTEREKLTDGSLGQYTIIKYLEKEWINGTNRYQPSMGAVVERYKMRPPFNGGLVSAQVLHAEDTKKVSLVLPNGREEKGLVAPGMNNVFIEDRPFAIIYTDGQKRYMLVDEDNDGKFEKRKELAVPPEYKTGNYTNDGGNEPAASTTKIR